MDVPESNLYGVSSGGIAAYLSTPGAAISGLSIAGATELGPRDEKDAI